ncbi:MAG TPA: hypothetical protein VFM79_05110 [Pelobium sp.]|nr:hypothetical protein [Pelobium sp.]
MKNLNRKTILIATVVILIGAMVYNSISQPGIKDLKTKFKEISSVRNEQNTGPILRAYLVTVDTANFKDMRTYGDFMPHTKYGNTKVYFFEQKKPFPNAISLTEPFFDEKFKKSCLAVYEKNGMGEVVFKSL